MASGRFKPFDAQEAAPGHTPGHTWYLLQDGGQAMLFWGDTVHKQPVQLPDPDVAVAYDWNVPLAIAARKHALTLSVSNGSWAAGDMSLSRGSVTCAPKGKAIAGFQRTTR